MDSADSAGRRQRAKLPSIGMVTVAVDNPVEADRVREMLAEEGSRQDVRVIVVGEGGRGLPEGQPTIVAGSLVNALDFDDLAVPSRDFLRAPYTAKDLTMRIQVAAARSLHHVERFGPEDFARIIRQIADSLPTAIIFADAKGLPRLRNRAVRDVLTLAGYDPATGMAEHVFGQDRKTRLKRGRNIVEDALAGRGRGVVYWIGDPAEPEKQRAIITVGHTIRRPDGALLGTAMVIHDVTDTAVLIGERSDYLASLSHELRNPLTAAIGFLDLALEDPDLHRQGSNIADQLATAQANLEHLHALLNRLSTIGLRSRSVTLSPTDLTVLMDRSIRAARRASADTGVRIVSHLRRKPMIGRADKVRLRQAVDNLISNAVKYTPEGGTVTVTLTRLDDDALIHVADTGVGITRADQDKIFDRFYHTPSIRPAGAGGYGIGLAIARTVAHAHAGTLTVESVPGQGSTFTLRIPLRPEGAPLPDIHDDTP
ncbi:MAG TPA: ATP-binding protein [Microbacteriaceae bacterium]|nr:ATP-binding protein [Microbacteriaceae bacterium]